MYVNGASIDGQLVHAAPFQGHVNLPYVGSQQGHSGQGRRADGKTLPGGRSGIAQGVQHLRPLPYFWWETTHLGITPRIIGHRAVGIGGQGYPQGGEHPHGGNGNAIES